MHLATRLFSISIFILTCSCFVQCKKNNNASISDNPYGLPNATQTGAGVFACRINGVNFVAGSVPFYMNYAQLVKDTIYMNGGIEQSLHFEGVGLFIKQIVSIGNYSIDSVKVGAAYTTDSTCAGISSQATTAFSKNGIIKITKFDANNKIVSGSFNCTFSIPNCDTLHITDGRFDYQYN